MVTGFSSIDQQGRITHDLDAFRRRMDALRIPHTVSCLAPLWGPILKPLLAELAINPTGYRTENGYCFVEIQCDAVTAGLIRARFHIAGASTDGQ